MPASASEPTPSISSGGAGKQGINTSEFHWLTSEYPTSRNAIQQRLSVDGNKYPGFFAASGHTYASILNYPAGSSIDHIADNTAVLHVRKTQTSEGLQLLPADCHRVITSLGMKGKGALSSFDCVSSANARNLGISKLATGDAQTLGDALFQNISKLSSNHINAFRVDFPGERGTETRMLFAFPLAEDGLRVPAELPDSLPVSYITQVAKITQGPPVDETDPGFHLQIGKNFARSSNWESEGNNAEKTHEDTAVDCLRKLVEAQESKGTTFLSGDPSYVVGAFLVPTVVPTSVGSSQETSLPRGGRMLLNWKPRCANEPRSLSVKAHEILFQGYYAGEGELRGVFNEAVTISGKSWRDRCEDLAMNSIPKNKDHMSSTVKINGGSYVIHYFIPTPGMGLPRGLAATLRATKPSDVEPTSSEQEGTHSAATTSHISQT